MLHSPVFRKSLLGSATIATIAGLGFLLGASVRPVAVEAQSPASTPPASSAMPGSPMPGASASMTPAPGASSDGAATTGSVAAPSDGPYVDAAPNVGTVGIAAPPSFAAPPVSSPVTFLNDPRYGFARELLKQNGVPLESILDPRSTAHPSALVERLIGLTQGSPKAMGLNLGVINEILGRAKRELGGDRRYISKLTYLQNAVTALQTAAQAGAPAAPAAGAGTGGSTDGRSSGTGATGAAAAPSAINGIYIAEARSNGRLADTLMPSPF